MCGGGGGGEEERSAINDFTRHAHRRRRLALDIVVGVPRNSMASSLPLLSQLCNHTPRRPGIQKRPPAPPRPREGELCVLGKRHGGT